MTMTEKKELLHVAYVAGRLGLSIPHTYRLAKTGEIPCIRIGPKALQARDYIDRDTLESVASQLGIMACSLETMKDFSGIHGYPMAARIQEYYRTQAAGKAA